MLIQGGHVPLYHQLKEALKERIRSGKYPGNGPLPGERQLVEEFGVSRTTVRQALNDLVGEGLLFRRHGKGTFVTPSKIKKNLGYLRGFAEELQDHGEEVDVKILSADPRRVSPEVRSRLQLGDESQTCVIRRLVSVQDWPVFIDISYLPWSIGRLISRPELRRRPIYNILESLGYTIAEGEEVVQADLAEERESKLLAIDAGSPVLRVKRITLTSNLSPIEYAEATYRADRYEYRIHLRRNPGPGWGDSTLGGH